MIDHFRIYYFRLWHFLTQAGFAGNGPFYLDYCVGFVAGPEHSEGDEPMIFSTAHVAGTEHSEGVPL